MKARKDIVIGVGEITHIMRSIANEINSHNKIIVERKSTRNDEVSFTYSLTVSGVTQVVKHFVLMVRSSGRPMVVGHTRFNNGDDAVDSMLISNFFPQLAKDSMSVHLNSNTLSTATNKFK